MFNTGSPSSLIRTVLIVSVYLLDSGCSLSCYKYNCQSSISTKCKIFPRWSADFTECHGTCFETRNVSKNFIHVNLGCTGPSTPGCRPVVTSAGINADEYFQFEACYCHTSFCNGGKTVAIPETILFVVTIFIVNHCD